MSFGAYIYTHNLIRYPPNRQVRCDLEILDHRVYKWIILLDSAVFPSTCMNLYAL